MSKFENVFENALAIFAFPGVALKVIQRRATEGEKVDLDLVYINPEGKVAEIHRGALYEEIDQLCILPGYRVARRPLDNAALS